MNILGISAYYHDSAAALICDGTILAAAQEERFTRRKHDARFPHLALAYCLQEAGLRLEDIDYFVFYDKPFLKFERILETYLAFAPRGYRSFAASLPIWVKEKLFQKSLLCKELRKHGKNDKNIRKRLLFSEHHQSHAASAFYPSPFDSAAVLTMDGVGEWATTTLSIGSGNKLSIAQEIHFPHSLGLLYSAFTYHLGFKVNSGEYKVMGLAPYGEPKYVHQIKEHLIDVKADGSFRLNLDYFDFCTGLRMTNKRFAQLFGMKARKPESDPLTQQHMDLAASIQVVVEEIVLLLAKDIRGRTGESNLCLAGGVALNCVANGKLAASKIFDNIWIQPAAGDAGGALGAALAVYYQHLNKPRTGVTEDSMQGSLLGPAFSQKEIEAELEAHELNYTSCNDSLELTTKVADALAAGKAIGWFQGRMEFGPRALGARSILADPRSITMQSDLNQKIKFRESFRPFAPAILAEYAQDWFDLQSDSPYMLLVSEVKKSKRIDAGNSLDALVGLAKLQAPRSEVPAITHVDFSARVQTVTKKSDPLFYELLSAFRQKTGCPILVNTSFNIRGEPIVATPRDAIRCFLGTGLDHLVIGNSIVEKSGQTLIPQESANYQEKFPLD